jgi:hypothetical protein
MESGAQGGPMWPPVEVGTEADPIFRYENITRCPADGSQMPEPNPVI